jgi:lipoprotein NlpI
MADYMPEFLRSQEMLLGTDFLRTHRVLVARSQHRVYFSYVGGQVFPATPALGCDQRVSGKNATQAMAVYDEAIAADPDDIDARVGRAALRLRANDSKGALEDLDQVLARNPANAVASSMRMDARAREKDYRGALADSDAAIANGMRTSHMYLQRATLWGLMGEDARALRELDEALDLDPRNVTALRARAHRHFAAGRHREAERDFSEAGNASANSRAYDAIWAALSRMRQGADAATALEPAAAKVKADQWPGPLVMYLLDRIDRDALMAAAARDEKQRKGQECEARFYSAQRLIAEKKIVEGRSLLEKARDDCPRDYLEYHEAVREIGKLAP